MHGKGRKMLNSDDGGWRQTDELHHGSVLKPREADAEGSITHIFKICFLSSEIIISHPNAQIIHHSFYERLCQNRVTQIGAELRPTDQIIFRIDPICDLCLCHLHNDQSQSQETNQMKHPKLNGHAHTVCFYVTCLFCVSVHSHGSGIAARRSSVVRWRWGELRWLWACNSNPQQPNRH